MEQTLAEKILARASGRASVQPGEIVTCAVDLAMAHDSSGPRRLAPRLAELGAKIWDPSKVVIATDHYAPAIDAESAAILRHARAWSADVGIEHFYDMQGICHVVLPERGHLRPGMFCVGGDSHSPTGGAFGAFMVGIGATEMTGVMVRGSIWIKVPETTQVWLTGAFAPGVSAKDVMLWLIARYGMANEYQVFEFDGPALASLDMHERMVLCNMTAELGAKTGIVAPDAATLAWLKQSGAPNDDGLLAWRSDPDACFARRIELDLSDLAPQVAAPHSPENAESVSAYNAPISIDQAYIGACTGAKISDLRMAARVLKGRKVHPRVRLLIAPASTRMLDEAARDGTLAALTSAGAILLPSGCGACAGYGAGLLAAGEVCLSSTARNFKGRMGHKESLVYLGSPYTVAAGAVAGHIVDPRPYLAGAAADQAQKGYAA
jgi:3-isopropylmalate/(R)-2-methylmalate dehydratase large subunit